MTMTDSFNGAASAITDLVEGAPTLPPTAQDTAVGSVPYKPLDERVVVLPDAPETVSPGGLVIPEQAREQQTVGTVLAVGPGLVNNQGVRKEMTVKVGDRVIYGKYAGTEYDDHVILLESEILAVVE